MSGRWVSQRVHAMGAMKAEGITRALGRADLDRLTVLVREAAQNSWDAADEAHVGPVNFSVSLRRLDDDLARRWISHFGQATDMRGADVQATLTGSEPLIMFVSDRGTKGLGGPTRADVEVEESGVKDYVSFALNIGDPRDTPMGGGTYGFGKAVFFTASRARTIVVHTRCRIDGRIESRLIGIALGESHSVGGENLTGRHWWGVPADDDGETVQPLRDGDADGLAAELGFPGFEDAELGTTVAVIGPQLGDLEAEDDENPTVRRTPVEAAEWIAEAILWHLWPKMVPNAGGEPDMIFSVSVDDIDVPVPAPHEHRATRLMAELLSEVEAGSDRAKMLRCGNPRQDLGRLALKRTFEPPPFLSAVAAEAGLTEAVHHVCLLRGPRLVVEYRSGPTPTHENVWYAGVFKAIDELDQTFADAEPPTHDAWKPEQLEAPDKTFVNVALREITSEMRSFAAPQSPADDAAGPLVPLGAASKYFASLLGDVTGEGGSAPRPGTGGSGSRRQVRLVGDPVWQTVDGEELLVQTVEVSATRTVAVEPKLAVTVWGGRRESDPPAGARGPQCVGWRSPTGELIREAAMVFKRSDRGEWGLLIRPAPDTVTSVSIAVGAGEESE